MPLNGRYAVRQIAVLCVQRLCEEMEYSDLLDRLPAVADPHERMVYIL